MMITLTELDHLYCGGDPGELPSLPTSFADYVGNRPELAPEPDESRLPQLAADRDYWRARLASLPPAPPLAAVSTLFDTGTPAFERVEATIDAVDWAQIGRSCRAQGVTAASLLLTGYARALAAWSGSQHFCINVTLFDRDPGVPGVEHIIGDFTSLVLLECRIDAAVSIWDQARQTQRQLMTDLPHRAADAVWLQRELLRHHGRPAAAIFPVVFTSGLGLVDSSAEPASFGLGDWVFGASQTPQTVLDFQVWENAGALRLSWDFVTQAVAPSTARANLDLLVANLMGATGSTAQRTGDGELLDSVLEICAGALGRTRVAPGDNFFQLGGDSVTATSVVEQVSRELSPSATLRLLFANPVIGEFAAQLEALAADDLVASEEMIEEGSL